MHKLIVIVTQVFETAVQAGNAYEEISGELRNHPDLHISGRVVVAQTAYSPEHPNGHEVPL